jgi:hypothetical protein
MIAPRLAGFLLGYPVEVLPTVERVPDELQEKQALKTDSKISR